MIVIASAKQLNHKLYCYFVLGSKINSYELGIICNSRNTLLHVYIYSDLFPLFFDPLALQHYSLILKFTYTGKELLK